MLDKQLDGREFIADEFSLADIICWPWTVLHNHHGQAFEDYSNLHRWHLAMRERPAVERACGDTLGVFEKPAELDDEARRNLFGHKPTG